MFAIRNYTDTKCELEMAKTRLNLLIDKKISIYNKYFPVTKAIKEIVVDGSKSSEDKMVEYIREISEIDIGTGMSLEQEIEYQRKKIVTFQGYLDSMDDTLGKISGIEYKLFYEIVYRGTSVSKAVEKIAEMTEKDTSTIWKNYYSKIKKDIKKIAAFSKTPVKVQ